jgi:hypothetical protein
MDESGDDPAMTKVRALVKERSLSLQALGLKMGYPDDSARKSAWQFLQGHDPRIGMLRRFCRAFDISIATLVRESGSGKEETGAAEAAAAKGTDKRSKRRARKD